MKVFHAIVLTNQFKSWVRNARTANADLRIAIKADATTPYSVIKNVMNSLQEFAGKSVQSDYFSQSRI